MKRLTQFILVGILPLIFCLLPRMSFEYSNYLRYIFIFTISIAIIVFFLEKKALVITKEIKVVFFIIVTLTFSIICSCLIEYDDLTITNLIIIGRPLFFFCILFVGYIIAMHYKREEIESSLVKISIFILIFELLISLIQLFDLTYFNNIYNVEKAFNVNNNFRVVGTVGNPNFLAWIAILMYTYIFFYSNNRKTKILALSITIAILLLSGSRSYFIIFPFLYIWLNLAKWKIKNYSIIKISFNYLLYSIIALSIGILFIVKFGSEFKYLNQLMLIWETGELTSINSFNARILIWSNYLNNFKENINIFTFLFGFSINLFSSMDNDYLYSFGKFGVIGAFLNYLIYIIILLIAIRLKNKKDKFFLITIIFVPLIIGIQAETLSGWNYPIIILYYIGLKLGFRVGKLNNQ